LVEPPPVFEIIVETVPPSNEETVSEEPVYVEEVTPVEPAPVEEVAQIEPKPTPEPVEEVVATAPEPEPAVEEVKPEDTVQQEETTSADIESADNQSEGYPIIVKVSHYNPSLGGPNCARFVNGECLSKMSNGERWQDYWGQYNTIACPFELPFGTVIRLDGNDFTCRDRGGAIVVTYEGYYWIDILAERVPYSYGELREAYIVP
jgi:type IV secretory pathway VirB10-like protein